MVRLIDTHTHLYDTSFTDDFDAIIARARECGVSGVILPAIDSACYKQMIECADTLQGFAYPATGLHPTSVKENWREELEFVMKTVNQRKFVAVGEIGIDGYWSKEYLKEQLSVFQEQIELAVKIDLPVIVHMRDSTEEIFRVLDSCSHLPLRGVFHAYSGSFETYRRLRMYGDFMFGIGGVVTYKNSRLSEVVNKMSLDSIVLETDSPWLTPAPYRGKRNEPSYVKIVAEKVAEIKKISPSEVAEITTLNAMRMFNLD